MKTIAVASEKGGVGKTTTSQSLAYGLHDRGYNVLMIDCDPQSSLTMLSGVNVGDIGISLMDVLTGKNTMEDAIRPVSFGLDVIPSGMELSLADMSLSGTIARELLLKNALEPIQGQYDFCVLDCSPSFSLVTLCALSAADYVIVPATLDILSLQALIWFRQYATSIKQKINHKMIISGILITMYDSRLELSKALLTKFESIAASMGTKVFDTRIRKSVGLQKAQLQLSDVYGTHTAAADDYRAFITEFISTIE